MEKELKTCLSALVRNIGKTVFTEKELLMTLSLDLHWMSHGEAKKLYAALMSYSLLQKNEDLLSPSFDVSTVDLPVGYFPSKELIQKCSNVNIEQKTSTKTPVEDIMPELINRATKAGIEKKNFIMQSNKISKKLGIATEVAGLFFLKENGIDVSDLLEATEQLILSR